FWLGADTGYTDRITSLNTNGFSLGKSKNVNESGYTYHYIAWNEVAGSMKTGSYVGVDGPGEPDSQKITGFAFEPEFVILRPNDSNRGHMQFASNPINGDQDGHDPEDQTFPFSSDDGNSKVIIDFGVDGMTIGDSQSYANKPDITYHYIAWKKNISTTVPPLAATGLSTSAMSHTGLTLSWIDNSSGDAQETSYVVKYSTTGPGSGFDTTAATVGPDVTSAPITGLLPNTPYWFRVTATNTAGSADSASLPVTTWASPITDPSLTNVSTFTELKLRLTWTNGTQPGMKIEQDTGCDGSYESVFYDNPTLLTGSPKTVSSGLVEHMCYKFRFGTYNSAGQLNTNYTTTNFVTTPPGQAQGVVPTSVTTNSITWAWESVAGADSYRIYSDLGGILIGTVPAGTLSYTRSPLGSNSLYVAVVRAYSNTDGEGIASVPSSVYTLALPPLNARFVSATSSSITWAWDLNGQASFFAQDKNNPADNSGWAKITSWTQTGLFPGTSYTLQVKARNAQGVETIYSEVTASTLP
ncbi:MAG: fibronectin type III domain-containing protein, partial [Candidatus Peregrinibacteria bacterium]